MDVQEYKDKNGVQLIEALNQFDRIHTPRGFINTGENGEALIKHLADNNMPPTLASLEQSAAMHTPELGFKMYYTPDEQALNAVRAQYPQQTLDVFDAWWKFQHVEKNPRSEAAVLTECRGHAVDRAFLDLALGRAASKGLITFLKAPGQHNYIPGQYSDKNLRDEVKPEEVTDALGVPLHRAQNTVRGEAARQYLAKIERDAEARRAPAAQTEAYWESRADKACGANLASTRAELARIVVSKPSGGIDWKATAEKREALQATIGSR